MNADSFSSRNSRFLTEAAGVKVIMTATDVEDDLSVVNGAFPACRISLKLEIAFDERKSWGFHLSRSKWDPYPWVGHVDPGSSADFAGLKSGDCLLSIEETDLVGLRVKDVAKLMRKKDEGKGSSINMEVWRSYRERKKGEEESSSDGIALSGPLPEVAKKLAKAVAGTVRALECPVCLESACAPVSQCVHGHILCFGCRAKTPRCPVCRVRLGQGRCLLADQVSRTISEAFQDEHDDVTGDANGASLRERLFGRAAKKKSKHSNNSSSMRMLSPAKVKSSIAKLLLGGFDKAASAENLSTADQLDVRRSDCPVAFRRLGELSQNDRLSMKSASTGELSMPDEPRVRPDEDGILPRFRNSNRNFQSANLLSVPATPTWGGSTESINNNFSFPCPLSRSTGCRESVSANFVIEHLARSHETPQIHFQGRIAKMPLPPPFGPDSTNIFHHRGELFFFQYEDEKAWMSAGSGTENPGEWTIYGQNTEAGTEIKLRKLVARLDDVSAPLPCHLAPLPKALAINHIVIELLDTGIGEALEV